MLLRTVLKKLVPPPPREYFSCHSLRKVAILSNGAIYSCCCLREDLRNASPYVKFENYSKEGIERGVNEFLLRRERLIEALRTGQKCVCDGCPSAVKASEAVWNESDPSKISVLAISPDWPCQLSCTYCGVPGNTREIVCHREIVERDMNFDVPAFIAFLERRNLLQLTAPIELSGGEISIFPKREEVLTALSRYPLQIFSNAIIYDEQIAKLIARSDGSFLNVSIDAGTPETYLAIKGLNAFKKVSETLRWYAENGGHIQPKYILLQENCDQEDLDGFLNLCVEIHSEMVHVSCNLKADPSNLGAVRDAAVYLAREGKRRGLRCNVLPYFGEDNMAYIMHAIE